MSIKPYVPDIEAWVAHFKNRDNFKVKQDFYEVKPIKRPPGAPKPQPPIVQIKMVTPQAQVVEQAKAQLAKEKEVLKQQHIKSRIHLLKERQMPHAKSRLESQHKGKLQHVHEAKGKPYNKPRKI